MSLPQDPASTWAPKQAPIMTRWAKDVRPDRVHSEYPRPQMVRKDWMNLNGLWDLEISRVAEPMASFARWRGEGDEPEERKQPGPAPLEGGGPAPVGSVSYQGKILVPFPVESALSGVMRAVAPEDQLHYRRTFNVPTKWKDKRVLLHFGAVDWSCEVKVNGKEVGRHRGGYDPFSFDVTDALRAGENELTVLVRDPTNKGTQPIGKQILKPEGIWYTPTSGIWQTVWLEPVPEVHIQSLRLEPSVSEQSLTLTTTVRIPGAQQGVSLGAKLLYKGSVIAQGSASANVARGTVEMGMKLKVENPRLWSPDSPELYDLEITAMGVRPDGKPAPDTVKSYSAFRTISLGKDERGRTRICLNGKPLFLVGPLDQGFWPDGLYTAPTDAALKYDLEVTKKLGFNFVRKHVKVEPARWYTHCDRMGLLVFQDMPSGGEKYIGHNDPDITRSPESAEIFTNELTAMINAFRNHPSIIGWVPFNEGWGQWNTKEVTELTRKLDPTRLVDNPSGWTDRGVGDMMDIHAYPGPASPKPEPNRAAFLGEFGGLGLPMPGHMWQKTGWGYRSYKTNAELSDAVVALFESLRFLIDEPGLSGAVYTQTTDVELEVNGLMTYDREKLKIDGNRLKKAVLALFGPPPVVRTVVPTSEAEAQTWLYSTTKSEGFERPEFEAAGWRSGPGGFGTRITPGHVVRTEWNTPDIWLRREFLLPKIALKNPHVRIHHDEDVEVYLDGKLLFMRGGYTTGYVLMPLPRSEAKRLTPGRHVLAVHCKQTGGGQYIDVGIVDVQ